MRDHLVRASAILLSFSIAGCIDTPATPAAPADDTSQTVAAETTTCTRTQLCCSDVGLTTNPAIAAVLSLLGISGTANQLVGIACTLTDAATCHETSVCCSSSVQGLGGLVGLNCTID